MRTCTAMIYADGISGTRRYAVMQGPMRGRVFDANRADIVAVYELQRGEEPDYRAMTAKHATPKAPAVRWQA
jgi:hypothetical protein